MLSGTDHREGMGGWFSVLVCSTCGLGRVEPWPEDPMAWYPDAYQQHSGPDRHRARVEAAIRAAARSRRCRPSGGRRPSSCPTPTWAARSPGARVLDVGAGNGAAVRALRAAGVDAHGIEPEERAVAAARAAGVTTVSVGTLEATRSARALGRRADEPGARARARPGRRAGAGAGAPGARGAGGDQRPQLRLAGPAGLRRKLGRARAAAATSITSPAASLARALAQAGLAARTVRTAALFGVLPASADAATAGGRRQRGWGRSVPVRAALYPLELAIAAAGGGDGLVAVAHARD